MSSTSLGPQSKLGGSSLVQETRTSEPAGTPGKRTLTEQITPQAAATYTVKAGENLAAIAAKLHVPVNALRAANADKLKTFPTRSGGAVQGFNAGTVIAIPGAATEQPAPELPAPSATAPAPAAATTAPASPAAATQTRGFFEGLFGSLGEAIHEAWDYVTGDSPAVDAHPAADGKPGAPAGPVTAGAPQPAPVTGGAPTPTPPPAPVTAGAPQPAPGVPGTAPMADLGDTQRGERLSTFHDDELGTVDKFGMSKTGRDAAKQREQWLSAADIKAAGKGKSGEAFVDAVDALVDKTKFSQDQTSIVNAAREFSAQPRQLTAEQENKAVIDWSNAQLTLDGVSLNADLKARLVKYVRFLAWAGLVTGPTSIGSVMRSPQVAHKLSVAWMFNLGANTTKGSTLHKADNRQKLVNTVSASGGTDADGNAWLSDATVEGLKSRKTDDDALFDYIKTTAAPEANKLQTQKAIAAEGYKTADRRHPNVLGGTSVSNHLLGEAVDMTPPFVLNNKFDPLIDAIAMHFGLWRAVKDDASSPEHWHYERLGMPPGAEAEPEH